MPRSLLLLISIFAFGANAAEGLPTYDPESFKKRFARADLNNDKKLSRQEAYAEFPRMPEFFDEIDANKDGLITITEVNLAIEKRVDAALAGHKLGKQHLTPSSATGSDAPDSHYPSFPSRQAAKRHYRATYYEEVSGRISGDGEKSEPIEAQQAPYQFERKF